MKKITQVKQTFVGKDGTKYENVLSGKKVIFKTFKPNRGFTGLTDIEIGYNNAVDDFIQSLEESITYLKSLK